MAKDENANISLRQKAEERFKEKLSNNTASVSEIDAMKLLHELEVHQIELEMQNEELKKARDEAESMNEKYAMIYDFAPAGYFTIDMDGAIHELNFSAAQMIGYERSFLIKKNIRRYIATDALPVFDDFLQNVFSLNTKQTSELRFLSKDNSSYIHAEGISYNDEREKRCLITAIDITERKEVQKRLQESEIRYRRLFETSKDGILILDANNGQIEDVNPFLCDLIGYSHEELLEKELWEIGAFKNIAKSKDAFKVLQDEKYIRFENMPLETKEGKSKDVEFVSNVYWADKKKVIQCNVRDIRERKLIEEGLKNNETRLKELNATKDKFLSIISHDLRSPFSSIIGFSELIVDKINKKDFDEVRNYAKTIQNSSWRAMDMLTNLIEWSRAQTGKMRFNPEYFEISELIDEVLKLARQSAKQKEINVSAELPYNITVFADKSMINSTLRNLVFNAIKFTNCGGEIKISAKMDKEEVIISVTDNGIGIEKDTIEKLFQDTESFSTIGTENERGTGFGLQLCKEFTHKHGGRIWAESKHKKGSRFSFTIPKVHEKVEH